ncbi:MAG: hypothetical protein COT74_02975 [Bdellovibrionales bacterium CG10_big_fil_rev_8_21_14_0_10_45_34]|nr:MAG: hypothetical protein COT74_02975 [Bdellovibrionales bacterium CG10_big_fil_rev_8_21_14_0_10_45_34]
MKLRSNLKNLVLASVTAIVFELLTGQAVQAQKMSAPRWGTGTHGGVGIFPPGDRSKLYLVDLYEKGLHLNPYFANLTARGADVERLKFALGDLGLKPEALEKIAVKLYEIELLDPMSYEGLLLTIEMHQWYRSPLPLAQIELHDTIVDWEAYRRGGGKLYQLATRQDRSITVNAAGIDLMDGNNQAALIFHEVYYSLTYHAEYKYKDETTNDVRTVWIQEGKHARSATALTFSTRFREGLKQLQQSISPRVQVGIFSELCAFKDGVYRREGSSFLTGATAYSYVQHPNLFVTAREIKLYDGADLTKELEYVRRECGKSSSFVYKINAQRNKPEWLELKDPFAASVQYLKFGGVAWSSGYCTLATEKLVPEQRISLSGTKEECLEKLEKIQKVFEDYASRFK